MIKLIGFDKKGQVTSQDTSFGPKQLIELILIIGFFIILMFIVMNALKDILK